MQPNTNGCGYHVMKNMLDIVSTNITNSWMKVYTICLHHIYFQIKIDISLLLLITYFNLLYKL